MNIEEALANVPIFRDIPAKSRHRLAQTARERHYKSGETIIKEGDEGVALFIVVEGTAESSRNGVKIASYGSGDYFGEMALLDNHRRSATIAATTDTTAIAISRWDFVSEVRENSDVALSVIETLSRRLRELDERLAQQ